jgi:hypothetical protein
VQLFATGQTVFLLTSSLSGWRLESTPDDGGHWATVSSFQAQEAPNGVALQPQVLAAAIAPSGDLLIASSLTDFNGDYEYLDLRRSVDGGRTWAAMLPDHTWRSFDNYATFSSLPNGSLIFPTGRSPNQWQLTAIECR